MLIQHRINNTDELKNVPHSFGVEVDVRSSGKDLICAHDAFTDGELFSDWLKYFKHRFLIVNIKSEGIENSIIEILNKFAITNYFFLDVSFPFMCKLTKEGFRKFAYRVSDLEAYDQAAFKWLGCNWIWLDAFNYFPANEIKKVLSTNQNVKICLVSPELHLYRDNKVSKEIEKQIHETKLTFDAICTKEPQKWNISKQN